MDTGPAASRRPGMTTKSTPLAHVDEVAGNRGGGGHHRRDEVGAAAEPLAPLEIAVRGRGATLARHELVRIHGEAHGAAGLAPFETGLDENLVEPFRLRLILDQAGARTDHRVDFRVHVLARHELVRINGEAHGAAGLAPFETGLDENLVEPFRTS